MMKNLPTGVIIGSNENAVQGGLKLWDTPLTLQTTKKTPRKTKVQNGK